MNLTARDVSVVVVAAVCLMIALDSGVEYNRRPDDPGITVKIDPDLEAAMSDAQRAELDKTRRRLEQSLSTAREAANAEHVKNQHYYFMRGIIALTILAFCILGRMLLGTVFRNPFSGD
jgi:hypothetical protein